MYKFMTMIKIFNLFVFLITILSACSPIDDLNDSYSWTELYTCGGVLKNIHHYHLGKQYINGTLPIYYENDKLPKDYVKFSKDSVITLTKSNALIDLSYWYIGKEIYYQKSYNNNLQKAAISKIGIEQDMIGNNIEYAILKPQAKKDLKILKNIGFPYHYGLGSKKGEIPNCETIFHLLELKKGDKIIYKPYIESEFKQINYCSLDSINELSIFGKIQNDTIVITAQIPYYEGNLKILAKTIENKLFIYPFNIYPHEWTYSETNKIHTFEAKIKLLNIDNIKSIVFSDWESFLYEGYSYKEFPIVRN